MSTLSGLTAAGSSPLPVCTVTELSQCLHCYRIISRSEEMATCEPKALAFWPFMGKTGQGPQREGLCWCPLGLLIAWVLGSFLKAVFLIWLSLSSKHFSTTGKWALVPSEMARVHQERWSTVGLCFWLRGLEDNTVLSVDTSWDCVGQGLSC